MRDRLPGRLGHRRSDLMDMLAQLRAKRCKNRRIRDRLPGRRGRCLSDLMDLIPAALRQALPERCLPRARSWLWPAGCHLRAQLHNSSKGSRPCAEPSRERVQDERARLPHAPWGAASCHSERNARAYRHGVCCLWTMPDCCRRRAWSGPRRTRACSFPSCPMRRTQHLAFADHRDSVAARRHTASGGTNCCKYGKSPAESSATARWSAC